MSRLQQQIVALFSEYDDDIKEVVASVLEFEIENIHLRRPRYKESIISILEQVARKIPAKDDDHEN